MDIWLYIWIYIRPEQLPRTLEGIGAFLTGLGIFVGAWIAGKSGKDYFDRQKIKQHIDQQKATAKILKKYPHKDKGKTHRIFMVPKKRDWYLIDEKAKEFRHIRHTETLKACDWVERSERLKLEDVEKEYKPGNPISIIDKNIKI